MTNEYLTGGTIMINFEELQETIVPNFKGGEGNTIIRK